MDEVLYLISVTYQTDDYGVRRPTETKKEVYCKVSSVTRAEFFGGGRAGLNPDHQFSICAADYNGEQIIEYDGDRYSVYRVYHVPGTDYLEMYTERKGGTNANPNSSTST